LGYFTTQNHKPLLDIVFYKVPRVSI